MRFSAGREGLLRAICCARQRRFFPQLFSRTRVCTREGDKPDVRDSWRVMCSGDGRTLVGTDLFGTSPVQLRVVCLPLSVVLVDYLPLSLPWCLRLTRAPGVCGSSGSALPRARGRGGGMTAAAATARTGLARSEKSTARRTRRARKAVGTKAASVRAAARSHPRSLRKEGACEGEVGSERRCSARWRRSTRDKKRTLTIYVRGGQRRRVVVGKVIYPQDCSQEEDEEFTVDT